MMYDTINITSTPNSGWQCPMCEKCYAPHIGECRTCGKDESEQLPDPGIGIPGFTDYTGNSVVPDPQPDWKIQPVSQPVYIPTVFTTPNTTLPGFTVTCSAPPSLQDLTESFDAGDDFI
jgi:hypothetical protein